LQLRLLSSSAIRVAAITLVLLGSGMVFLVTPAAAQTESSEIVIGLQNDMTDMNTWNPGTNTVWKSYQIGSLNFESLLGTDPDGNLFPLLADPARGGGTGYTVLSTPVAPDAATVDVFIRSGVTFTDGQPMTAADVVFSFQTQGWGTYSSFINEALWWNAPRFAHWTGGAAKSHIGVEAIGTDTVRFHLSKTYALFFVATLSVLIMPKHIWLNHIDADPPLNYTSLTPITDAADRSIDFGFGGTNAQRDATIGTGPWKTMDWARNQATTVTVSPTYWGKDRADASVLVGATRYNFYPDHVRSIRFVIYSSLDVISLALQSGEIDTLIWPLLPGFLSQVRSNPAISVEQVTDSGMFYLSFNLRRSPWNDLDLRKAISMAIDKDYIVNTLMGGLGIKGTVPHAIVRPEYINQSAVPPSFDLAGAADFLDSVGIVDRNGDGFREYKDGSPIRTAILTPPKDYDPIRADAGIMISNNLKKIGLNIDAAPTSFDTIVAKAFLPPVDFDIYILGFSLGTLPEGYLKDFFGSSQDVNINPAGSNSAGYHNSVIDAKLETMLVTLDNNARIRIVKDIVGQVVKDIPWNILYYRKNLNAYRNDRWVGWVNSPPQLYSFWSLAKLSRPGPTGTILPFGPIKVAVTAPERAIAGTTVTVDVFGTRDLAPISGAAVWLNRTYGIVTDTSTGTTDASGHARFSVSLPFIQGDVSLKATVVKGGSTGTQAKVMQISVKLPVPIVRLGLSTTTPVIGVGETAQVLASVTDSLGLPVPGAEVKIDTTLVFSTIAPSSGTTDANGQVIFTYSAPATAEGFPNQHLLEVLKANTTVGQTIVTDTQLASLLLFVENDNAPDWLIADVSATKLVLNVGLPGDSTTLDVTVRDFAGVPRQGVDVTAVLPDSEAGSANVTVTPTTATTDATGVATFAVTETAAAVQGNVPIRFVVGGTAYQVSDVAGLLISDLTTKGYAALIDFTDRSITSSPAQTTDVSVQVWNELGVPATDAAVIFQIAPGSVGMQAQFTWAYDYSVGQYLGEGLDLAQFDYGGSFGPSFEASAGQASGYGADNALNDWEVLGYPNSATAVPIDSCDPAGSPPDTSPWPADFPGYYIVNATGQLTGTIRPAQHKGDSSVQVRAFIGSTASASRLRMNVTTCSSNPATFFGWGVSSLVDGAWVPGIENAAFMIDSGLIIEKAPILALGSVTVGSGGELFTSASRTLTVQGSFYDRNGPAGNAKVFLLRGAGTAARNVRGSTGGTILTNSTTGIARQDVTVPLLSLSQAHFFAFLAADERYAYGGRNQLLAGDYLGDYYLNQFQYVQLAKIPMEFVRPYVFLPNPPQAYATVQVDKMLVPEQGSANATVTVVDGSDVPIANATVWSGPVQTLTDVNGSATIPFTATLGSIENLAVAQTPDGFVVRAWYGIVASRPVLSYGTITVNSARVGEKSTISLSVTNTLTVAGPATVTLLVDGVAVASKAITIGASASQTVTFDQVFATAGDHAVAIGTQSATASIAGPLERGFIEAYGLASGLLVVGLAVGAVVGIMLSRRGRPPSGSQATMAEEEMRPGGGDEL
jgi:peptide/nickel transport system substrate-binding protein